LSHLRESLGMKNCHLRWIPHGWMTSLRQIPMEICRELLPIFKDHEKNRFVTGDESWFTLEFHHSMKWSVSRDDVPQKVKQQIGTQKFMLTVIWGIDGFHDVDLIIERHNHNTEWIASYVDINSLFLKSKHNHLFVVCGTSPCSFRQVELKAGLRPKSPAILAAHIALSPYAPGCGLDPWVSFAKGSVKHPMMLSTTLKIPFSSLMKRRWDENPWDFKLWWSSLLRLNNVPLPFRNVLAGPQPRELMSPSWRRTMTHWRSPYHPRIYTVAPVRRTKALTGSWQDPVLSAWQKMGQVSEISYSVPRWLGELPVVSDEWASLANYWIDANGCLTRE
jgi:hypothetical protein